MEFLGHRMWVTVFSSALLPALQRNVQVPIPEYAIIWSYAQHPVEQTAICQLPSLMCHVFTVTQTLMGTMGSWYLCAEHLWAKC